MARSRTQMTANAASLTQDGASHRTREPMNNHSSTQLLMQSALGRNTAAAELTMAQMNTGTVAE